MEVAGANRRGRCPFRCRGSRRESAVAQLFSLGDYAVALKNKLGWDDALDVWGVHGVGGFIGIVLCGVFATTAFNPAGVDGLLRGNAHFFWIQLLAVMRSE